MPGLGGRMSTVIKAKINKMLDKAEDPSETLEYSYAKQMELLQNVKKGIADVVTAVNWCYSATYWACLPRALRRVPRVGVPIFHIECDWTSSPHYDRMLRNCDASIVFTEAERDFVAARGGRSIAVAGAEKLIRREIDANAHKALLDELAAQI